MKHQSTAWARQKSNVALWWSLLKNRRLISSSSLRAPTKLVSKCGDLGGMKHQSIASARQKSNVALWWSPLRNRRLSSSSSLRAPTKLAGLSDQICRGLLQVHVNRLRPCRNDTVERSLINSKWIAFVAKQMSILLEACFAPLTCRKMARKSQCQWLRTHETHHVAPLEDPPWYAPLLEASFESI